MAKQLLETKKYKYGIISSDYFADLGFTESDWDTKDIHVYLNGMRMWDEEDYKISSTGIYINGSGGAIGVEDCYDHLTVDIFE